MCIDILGVRPASSLSDGAVYEINEVLLRDGAAARRPRAIADDGRIDIVVQARPRRTVSYATLVASKGL